MSAFLCNASTRTVGVFCGAFTIVCVNYLSQFILALHLGEDDRYTCELFRAEEQRKFVLQLYICPYALLSNQQICLEYMLTMPALRRPSPSVSYPHCVLNMRSPSQPLRVQIIERKKKGRKKKFWLYVLLSDTPVEFSLSLP